MTAGLRETVPQNFTARVHPFLYTCLLLVGLKSSPPESDRRSGSGCDTGQMKVRGGIRSRDAVTEEFQHPKSPK